MKPRWLLGVLILSLVFNVFFVLGAIREQERRDPIASITQVANELNLDDQQAHRLAELRASFQENTGFLQEELREVRDAMAEQMAAEDPNGSTLRDLMEREATLVAQRREAAQAHFGQFVDLLTPEQRHDLGQRMHPKRRGMRGKGPLHDIEQFDADRDGALNEDERRAAKRHADDRRSQQTKWREELRARFDADQDGHLAPEEREAMRAWLLEQGFSPPEGRPPHDHRRRGGQRPDGAPPHRGGPGPNGGPPPHPGDHPPPGGPPPGEA